LGPVEAIKRIGDADYATSISNPAAGAISYVSWRA
jgi:hypothetical protein